MITRALTFAAALVAAYTLRNAVERKNTNETIESAVWLVCDVLLTR